MIASVYRFELKSPPTGAFFSKKAPRRHSSGRIETMAQDTQSDYTHKLRTVLDVTKAIRSIIHLDVLLDTIVQVDDGTGWPSPT